eukprot:GHVR01121490.1.p1 GENE.GHVR01121490.1~~GHVR01121490.1.p1  ORF type:complete len:395 (+),score=73.63 GHVR01121490.1:53-1186(+)
MHSIKYMVSHLVFYLLSVRTAWGLTVQNRRLDTLYNESSLHNEVTLHSQSTNLIEGTNLSQSTLESATALNISGKTEDVGKVDAKDIVCTIMKTIDWIDAESPVKIKKSKTSNDFRKFSVKFLCGVRTGKVATIKYLNSIDVSSYDDNELQSDDGIRLEKENLKFDVDENEQTLTVSGRFSRYTTFDGTEEAEFSGKPIMFKFTGELNYAIAFSRTHEIDLPLIFKFIRIPDSDENFNNSDGDDSDVNSASVNNNAPNKNIQLQPQPAGMHSQGGDLERHCKMTLDYRQTNSLNIDIVFRSRNLVMEPIAMQISIRDHDTELFLTGRRTSSDGTQYILSGTLSIINRPMNSPFIVARYIITIPRGDQLTFEARLILM